MHACFLNISMHSPLTGKQRAGAYILRKCPLLFVKWGFPIEFPIETFSVSPHKTPSAENDRILFFSWKRLLDKMSTRSKHCKIDLLLESPGEEHLVILGSKLPTYKQVLQCFLAHSDKIRYCYIKKS